MWHPTLGCMGSRFRVPGYSFRNVIGTSGCPTVASIKPAGRVKRASAMSRMEQQQQRARHFWLLKTEPDSWSWQNQETNLGLSVWDGVRNYQAQKMMKSMSVDDLCFFYHTGKLKEVAGIVRVVKTFYPDPTDDSEKWGAVDVKKVEAFKQPVTLAQMKEDDHFNVFKMLRQPRLSVVPVDESIWKRVCELGGVESTESLGVVKEETKTGVLANKKAAEVKLEGEKSKTDKPGKNATKASNPKKSKGSTEERPVETAKNGSAEERQTKAAGGRKRGAKVVNKEFKRNTKRKS